MNSPSHSPEATEKTPEIKSTEQRLAEAFTAFGACTPNEAFHAREKVAAAYAKWIVEFAPRMSVTPDFINDIASKLRQLDYADEAQINRDTTEIMNDVLLQVGKKAAEETQINQMHMGAHTLITDLIKGFPRKII